MAQFIDTNFRIGADAAVFVTLILIVCALIPEFKIRKQEANMMLCLSGTQMLELLFRILAETLLRAGAGRELSLTFLCSAFLCFIISILFLSLYMIDKLKQYAYINNNLVYAMVFACGVLAIVWIVGFFQPGNWFIYYGEGDILCSRLPFAIITGLCALVVLYDLVLAASFVKVLSQASFWSWFTIALLPLLACVFAAIDPGFPSAALSALSTVIIYVHIHIQESRQHAVAQKNLMESKSKLLVSQIQPHFIYNSLNSIYYLIAKDPEQAQDAVSTFSDYLRQNINSLKDDKPVRFEEELYHIDAYLKLELLRFGDELKIEKDVKVQNFLIPPLTVQPLVENAIKHGVSQVEGGGTVKISSEETEDAFIVKIDDDGAGFNAGSFKDDTSTHIGLFNVNSRIKTMCGGSLYVTSEVGKGTHCVISLPKAMQPKAKEE